MPGSCVRCYCGVPYAACYIFISIWGILFLGVMGILLKTGHKGNIGIEYERGVDEKKEDNRYGNVMLITVAMYFVLCVGCAFNIWWRLRNPWPEEENKDEQKQFSAIGPKNFEDEEKEDDKDEE